MTSSTVRDRSARFALPLILTVFVLIALVYSVSIPLGEAPDEVSHWSYVQYLTAHLRLPGGEGAAAGEAHQPPLYYLLGAFVSFSVPDQQFDVYANPDWYLGNMDTPNLLLHTRREAFPYRGGVLAWHLVRLFSILLGAITVWATYRIARLVFPDSAWVAPAAAAFVAFIPQFTFLSAVVNNDNLVIALSALALLAFLRTGRDVRARAFIITGVLLGLAVLAKVSAFSLWVAIALAMVVNGQGRPIRERATNLLVTFATASAVVSPWLVYSGMAFGDAFGFTRMAEGFARPTPMTGADWIIYGERMFVSFWGKFGGVTNVGMPDAVYAALSLLLLIGLVGDVFLLRDWRAGRLTVATRRGLVSLALFWVVLVASHLRLTVSMLGIDQARQWFPALPALGVLFGGGIARLARRPAIPALIIACGMGLIGLANASAVASVYSPPGRFADMAPGAAPMDFGGKIRVTGYRLDKTTVAPGDSLVVELQWQALKDIDVNYWLTFQLDGGADMTVNHDGVPSGGTLTTDWWRKGQVLSSRHVLFLPQDVPPGPYTLRLGLYPYGNRDWLRVSQGEMSTLGVIRVSDKP